MTWSIFATGIFAGIKKKSVAAPVQFIHCVIWFRSLGTLLHYLAYIIQLRAALSGYLSQCSCWFTYVCLAFILNGSVKHSGYIKFGTALGRWEALQCSQWMRVSIWWRPFTSPMRCMIVNTKLVALPKARTRVLWTVTKLLLLCPYIIRL